MKTILKIVLIIIVIFVLLNLAQQLFNFRIGDLLSNLLGGSWLESVRTNLSQQVTIPVFEIVSLEIFYPKNLSIIEVSKSEWWKLNIGTVFVLMEYDSFVKLGVRDPHSIKIERFGDTLYVDESTIVIELLDVKLSNYHYVRTFTSNPLVMNNDAEKHILNALNLIERELVEKMNENGQANFVYAKRNFKENYQLLCKAMGLEVVWR
jgi:hypothetical protein